MMLLFGKLDLPSDSAACTASAGCSLGLCFGGQNTSLGGGGAGYSRGPPRSQLEGSCCSPGIPCLKLAVVLEQKIGCYVFIQQLETLPDPQHPPSPTKKNKRPVSWPRPTCLVFTLSAPRILLTLKFTG